jgi:hypothetical protein
VYCFSSSYLMSVLGPMMDLFFFFFWTVGQKLLSNDGFLERSWMRRCGDTDVIMWNWWFFIYLSWVLFSGRLELHQLKYMLGLK